MEFPLNTSQNPKAKYFGNNEKNYFTKYFKYFNQYILIKILNVFKCH